MDHRVVKTLLLLSLSAVSGSTGSWTETVNGITSHPTYAQPLATTFGSMANSGWFQSGSVGRGFGFGVALPVALVFLNGGDRKYEDSYVDEACRSCVEHGGDCRQCIESQRFSAPTAFGSIDRPKLTRSTIDYDYDVSSIRTAYANEYAAGIDELSALSVLPFASLQISFSYCYTELKLRYLGIPPVSGFSFQLPGIGIQHDVSRFFPALPVSLSAAANFTLLSVSITPGRQIGGSLRARGLSNFLGVVTGYKIKDLLELFLETGWDHGFIHITGAITETGETARIDAHVPGRNGFRAGLNLALSLNYHPVVGGIAGAQAGTMVNVLSFRKKTDQ